MSGQLISTFHLIVEWAALGIELFAVGIIVGAVLIAGVHHGTVPYLFRVGKPGAYESYRRELGKALLFALELLVAADVIRTVALEPTLRNVEILGLLVVVRALLSWSMSVEVEGCWPWQTRAHSELQLATRAAESGANFGESGRNELGDKPD